MTASERRTDVAPSGVSARGLLLERTVLDEQIRRSRTEDPRPWGVLPWLGPLLTVPALVVGGYLAHPPVTLAVSDAVALGIAGILRSPTPGGEVLGRFYRTGTVDGDELIEACRVEQDYASPEGHAALYCLIGWVRAQVYRQRAGG